ncbi:iron complex transport system ATP-binding protein [Arthrobacter sp. cf158]|uniref:ABC transporter ATP-binding protein n=1 Tax=Arthrobacter sp. cf158 TaxID=1761744 RepID=UPI00089B8624|nr:ABC transporter ATP-binding protein [Arthrobacter sp. cf158]SDW57515.1 iron complex transport system ATP-binding protein [Arthrobacter sp. cf158]
MIELNELSGLEATDLVLRYGDKDVVHGAGLRLEPGRIVALVGPNGSGKSTLLRALARLHEATSGTVTVRPADGEASDALMMKRSDFARHVTLLSQSRPVPHGLSVRDVVEFGRHPYRGRWRAADPEGPAAVDRAMQLTGVAELGSRGVHELSGGQLQRVWLASCLAQDTSVLLLDEPTNHLDLRYKVEIFDLVHDLARVHGVAIGVVLHDLDEAAALADHVVVLSAGRIAAAGPAHEALDAELLTEVYSIPIVTHTDPLTGRLRTRAVGRHSNNQ